MSEGFVWRCIISSLLMLGIGSANAVQNRKPTAGTVGVAAITVTPSTIGGGSLASASVQLTAPAPTGGTYVKLVSSSRDLNVPYEAFVSAGYYTSQFEVTAVRVKQSESVTVTASIGASSQSTTVTVVPASLSSLTMSSPSVVGGSQMAVTGAVAFDGVPYAYSTEVTLTSSDPRNVEVPRAVYLVSGASGAKFLVVHRVVTSQKTVTITAKSAGITRTITLALQPFLLTSFAVTPSSVAGGINSLGAVILNGVPGAGSGPVSVTLSTSSSLIELPKKVEIGIGEPSKEFVIPTLGTSTESSATISAVVGPTKLEANLTVRAAVLEAISLKPPSVKGSAAALLEGTVKIMGKAPLGGLSVSLTSSDPAVVGVETKVTIPMGQSIASFSMSHKKVSALTPVSITATLNGISVSSTVAITP